MKQLFSAIKLTSKICKSPCAVRLFALRALFLLQPNSVCDHGDELAVCGLALGVGHGIAEVALQRLQIAAIPGYLDIFRACALKMGGRGCTVFSEQFITLFEALNISHLLGCLYHSTQFPECQPLEL